MWATPFSGSFGGIFYAMKMRQRLPSGERKNLVTHMVTRFFGAAGRIRTADLILTKGRASIKAWKSSNNAQNIKKYSTFWLNNSRHFWCFYSFQEKVRFLAVFSFLHKTTASQNKLYMFFVNNLEKCLFQLLRFIKELLLRFAYAGRSFTSPKSPDS